MAGSRTASLQKKQERQPKKRGAAWHRLSHRFRNADWSKSTRDIAEELGFSTSAVGYARRVLASHTCRPEGRPKGTTAPMERRLLRYRKVDWSLTDCEIARRLGVSHQAVAQARAVLVGAGNGRRRG